MHADLRKKIAVWLLVTGMIGYVLAAGGAKGVASQGALGFQPVGRVETRQLAVSDQTASSSASDAVEKAQALFADRCAVCHGTAGTGDGPGAESMNPKPVNFTDRNWQKSVSDGTIAKAIVGGGPAVGLSASMAANPDLEDQPAVLAALIAHIRKLGR